MEIVKIVDQFYDITVITPVTLFAVVSYRKDDYMSLLVNFNFV